MKTEYPKNIYFDWIGGSAGAVYSASRQAVISKEKV